MKVTEYLKQHSIEKLTEEYGVRVKLYDDLIVLNYNQCFSHLKFNDIVKECRGLILDRLSFKVVSRSFDRFYNYGELIQEKKRNGGNEKDVEDYISFKNCLVVDKIDGSLIKIYHYNDQWHISTRGTAFAEYGLENNNDQNTSKEMTFRDLVLQTLQLRDFNDFQKFCNQKFYCPLDTLVFEFDKNYTYIFELTTPQNKIVTDYKGNHILWFLAIRKNDSVGTYKILPLKFYFGRNVKFPTRHEFNDLRQCIECVKNLPNHEEGYVLMRNYGTKSSNALLQLPLAPICKIKSPTYVKLHHTKGKNNLSLKQIIKLVVSGEYQEYLTHYPEKEEFFNAYIDKINTFLEEGNKIYLMIKDCDDEKEFSKFVRHSPSSWFIYMARKSKSNDLMKTFQNYDNTNQKVNFLLKKIDWSDVGVKK